MNKAVNGKKVNSKLPYIYALIVIIIFTVGFYTGKSTGTVVTETTETTTITKTVTKTPSLEEPTDQTPSSPGKIEFELTPLGLKPSSWYAVDSLLEKLGMEGAYTRYYPYVKGGVVPEAELLRGEAPAPAPMPTVTLVATTTVATSTGAVSAEFSTTNVRVEGVDEHDIVKTNGTIIYVASGNVMGVYYAYPAENLELRETVDVEKLIGNISGEKVLVLREGDEYYEIGPVTPGYNIRGLYAYMDKVIIITEESSWAYTRTWIIEYKPGEGVVNYKWVSGWLKDSRLLNDTLTLVLTQPAAKKLRPLIDGIPIVPEKLVVAGQPRSYTTIIALNLNNWTHDEFSILGANPATVYMTTGGSLYVALETPKYRILEQRVTDLGAIVEIITRNPEATTIIAKLQVSETPNITVVGSVEIEGMLRKTWQLDEYKGVLRIVAESWRKGGINVDLYTINASTMDIIAKLENISVNERVHAVRFMGNILYLVTFRNIDPLFTIDLSDPANPRVLGFLEAPGFDEYMHPVSDNLLVGIGLERVSVVTKSGMVVDRTVRVTLYRINENHTVSAVKRIYMFNGTMTAWYSQVLDPQWGYKAFTIDPRHNYIMIPIVGVKLENKGMSSQEKGLIGFNGIALIKYDVESKAIELVTIVEHNGAARSLYIDDVIYTIAPYNLISSIQGYREMPTIKAFDALSLELISEA